MAEITPSAGGARPPGAVSEADASRGVRDMFSRIAPRYDLLNHLLSLDLDRLWRARVVRKLRPILARKDAVVLDLCCGTGDLTLALANSAEASVLGGDFAHPMLVRAREKAAGHPARGRVPAFVEADALRLPFGADSFSAVTSAFGFRNLANYEAGLREIVRVLRPGGVMAILEFTDPPPGLAGGVYRWYFRSVLPRVGGLISGDRSAYTYLPASVSRFFRAAELASLMSDVGFQSVDYRVWTFGTVALHTAVKA